MIPVPKPVCRGIWLRAVLAGCLAQCAFVLPANGQDAPTQSDDVAIRDAAKDVLDGPEFRRLRRLLEKNFGQHGWGPPGFGSGGDGSGGEGGDADGQNGRGSSGGNGTRSDRSGGDNRQGNSLRFSVGAASAIAAAFGRVYVALAWICVAAIVGLMLYLVVRAVGSRLPSDDEDLVGTQTQDRAVEEEHAPGDLPADVYIEASRKLAAAGRFREAIAQLLMGSMSRIERAGWIRFRRGLTHHDYLRAVRSRQVSHGGLREIVRTYEPIGFGRRTATRQHFDDSLRGYEALTCDE